MGEIALGRARDALQSRVAFGRADQIAEARARGKGAEREEFGEGPVGFGHLAVRVGDGDAHGRIAEEIGEADQRGRNAFFACRSLGRGGLGQARYEPPRRLAAFQGAHRCGQALSPLGFEIFLAGASVHRGARQAVEGCCRAFAGKSELWRRGRFAFAGAGQKTVGGIAVQHRAVARRHRPGNIGDRRRRGRTLRFLGPLGALWQRRDKQHHGAKSDGA